MKHEEKIQRAEEYFRHEVDHAWVHYRHLEEMRFKYVTSLMTLLSASVAVLVAAFRYVITGHVSILVGISVPFFVLVLFGCSLILLASVARIGYVLAAYEYIMIRTRVHFCGNNSDAYRIWDVRWRIPEDVSTGLFRVQKGSVALVGASCGVLIFAELLLLGSVWHQGRAFRITPIASVGIMLVGTIYMWRSIRSAAAEYEDQQEADRAADQTVLTNVLEQG